MQVSETIRPHESLIKYVKSGATLSDVLSSARADGVQLPNSLQAAALGIYRDWLKTHYPKNPEELRRMIIEEKIKAASDDSILNEEIKVGDVIYHINGIVHQNTTGIIEGDRTETIGIADIAATIRAKVEQDIQAGRTVFAEQNMGLLLNLPQGVIDLMDITNFKLDPFFSKRVAAYMETGEFKDKIAELGLKPVKSESQDGVLDERLGAGSRQRLAEFVLRQLAGEMLMGRDAYRMKLILNELLDAEAPYSSVIEEEQLNCKSTNDVKGFFRAINRTYLPMPLRMEVGFLLLKPQNVPLYAHQDFSLDRSFLQASRAREVMQEKGVKEGSLYIGAGHLGAVPWFLQNPEYDLRTSLSRAEGIIHS